MICPHQDECVTCFREEVERLQAALSEAEDRASAAQSDRDEVEAQFEVETRLRLLHADKTPYGAFALSVAYSEAGLLPPKG
jgi:hypothetical protein